MTKRSELLYIQDILNAIRNIEKYTRDMSFKKFSADQLVIDAVIRNFEIIGEASKHIPKQTKSKYPTVPWNEITGMRNKMIHEYFGVDTDIVWETIQNSLPVLKKLLKQTKD